MVDVLRHDLTVADVEALKIIKLHFYQTFRLDKESSLKKHWEQNLPNAFATKVDAFEIYVLHVSWLRQEAWNHLRPRLGPNPIFKMALSGAIRQIDVDQALVIS